MQQLLQQKSRVSESSLPCLPSDTAAAFLAVDRSVYAALASSFVTFVICNLAWQSQKHSSGGIVSAAAGSSNSNNSVPSGSPLTGGGEKADAGSKAAQSIQTIGDPKDVRDNDIWQVARSGLLQAGPGQPKPPKPAQQECAPTNVRSCEISLEPRHPTTIHVHSHPEFLSFTAQYGACHSWSSC